MNMKIENGAYVAYRMAAVKAAAAYADSGETIKAAA